MLRVLAQISTLCCGYDVLILQAFFPTLNHGSDCHAECGGNISVRHNRDRFALLRAAVRPAPGASLLWGLGFVVFQGFT